MSAENFANVHVKKTALQDAPVGNQTCNVHLFVTAHVCLMNRIQ